MKNTMNNINIETIATLTRLGDCRIMAGFKNDELKGVIDFWGTREALTEAPEEIQEAIKAIVSKVGVCTIDVSWDANWGGEGPCDIAVQKAGTDIAWVRFSPDGEVYDYLDKEVIVKSVWPISWDALRRLEELGYDPDSYQHVNEDCAGFWTVQMVDPMDETLWEIDLTNGCTRHKGQEVGCFWTEWEE